MIVFTKNQLVTVKGKNMYYLDQTGSDVPVATVVADAEDTDVNVQVVWGGSNTVRAVPLADVTSL